jgi:hypothetical protein
LCFFFELMLLFFFAWAAPGPLSSSIKRKGQKRKREERKEKRDSLFECRRRIPRDHMNHARAWMMEGTE